MANQLCGYETPTGPCTMKKGHKAKFHRHIGRKTFYWEIAVNFDPHLLVGERFATGMDKVPFLEALNDALDKHGKVNILAWVE